MRAEPSLPDKIEAISDLGELAGFEGQLAAEKRIDDRIKGLIAMRRHELRTMKGWK